MGSWGRGLLGLARPSTSRTWVLGGGGAVSWSCARVGGGRNLPRVVPLFPWWGGRVRGFLGGAVAANKAYSSLGGVGGLPVLGGAPKLLGHFSDCLSSAALDGFPVSFTEVGSSRLCVTTISLAYEEAGVYAGGCSVILGPLGVVGGVSTLCS